MKYSRAKTALLGLPLAILLAATSSNHVVDAQNLRSSPDDAAATAPSSLKNFITWPLRALSHDDDLENHVRNVFEFADARRGDGPIVRVFNPVRDMHGYERPGAVVDQC